MRSRAGKMIGNVGREGGERNSNNLWGKGKGRKEGKKKEREKKESDFCRDTRDFAGAPRQCTADGDRRKLLRGRLNDVNVDISL